jgi:hypothetical protein
MLPRDLLDGQALPANLFAKSSQRHPTVRKRHLERSRKPERLIRVDFVPGWPSISGRGVRSVDGLTHRANYFPCMK